MKHILLFIFFINSFAAAQSHRFIYEYSYKPDSLKQDSIVKKLMRLNITKDFSEFLPEKKAKSDSIIMKNLELKKTFDIEFSANDISTDSYTDLHSAETKVFAEIGIQQVAVKINELPQWNLQKETKKISSYNCQKATTFYKGRLWNAWFTNELPFQDGPYIFKGLPGLIVELEDQTKSHHFILKGNHNSTNNKINRFTMGKIVDLDESRFTKEWKKFKENPVPVMTQMQNRGIIFSGDVNLTSSNKAEIERIKKEIHSVNNAMLLQLYR